MASTKAGQSHPTYSDMIKQAIVALKDRNGSSRQAILKFMLANFNVSQNSNYVNNYLKAALRTGLEKGTIKHAKPNSVGVQGRFRLNGNSAKSRKDADLPPKGRKASVKPSSAIVVRKRKNAVASKTAVQSPQNLQDDLMTRPFEEQSTVSAKSVVPSLIRNMGIPIGQNHRTFSDAVPPERLPLSPTLAPVRALVFDELPTPKVENKKQKIENRKT